MAEGEQGIPDLIWCSTPRIHMNWLSQLECTEELGNIIRLHDMALALSVYLRANLPEQGALRRD